MSTRLEEQNGRRSFLKWAGALSALGLLRAPRAALAGKNKRNRGHADIVGTWIVHITFTSSPESEDVRKRGLSQFTANGQWIGTESALEPDSKRWTVRGGRRCIWASGRARRMARSR
jgi:hypothetical protein